MRSVIVGPFPPPVHGVSVINSETGRELELRGIPFVGIDIGPRADRGKVRYHLSRLWRVGSGIVRLMVMRLQGTNLTILMSVDGGLGILYNIAYTLMARLVGARLLLYHHSTRYIVDNSALMRLLVLVAGAVSTHVMCSGRMGTLLRTKYAISHQILTVGNAAWVRSLPHASRLEAPRPLILGHLSALSREKGLGWAIATLREAERAGGNVQLVLAGVPLDADAQQLIDDGLQEFPGRLIWQGLVAGEQKAAFFRGIDYFLFPSLYPHETQSMVVPEALANGVPVIAFDHRFVAELIAPEGGIVVATQLPYDQEAIAWIGPGLSLLPERRQLAYRQFERIKTAADLEKEDLIELLASSTQRIE